MRNLIETLELNYGGSTVLPTDMKIEEYLNSTIIAFSHTNNIYDEKKKKFRTVKTINCHLYREGSKYQPLVLRECNDGQKLTSISQAINQAKEIINFLTD